MLSFKFGKIRLVSLLLSVCIIVSGCVVSVSAATTPNWKSLYQNKVQQIETDYNQGRREKDDVYEISYYSLADFDFDGVPELYHALACEKRYGYEVQSGSEEIYYIKNNRVVLGKIESHVTLGLVPATDGNGTVNDRHWQYVMYNAGQDKVAFITKDSWTDSASMGNVIISELTFDKSSGVLSANEIINREFPRGNEPGCPSGYEAVAAASTFSVTKKTDANLWKWEPVYVNAEPAKSENKTSAKATWKDAYKEFVDGQGYADAKQRFFTENKDYISFALWDMNADGIPELICKNGAKNKEDMVTYIYTFKNDKLMFLSKAGTGDSNFLYSDDSRYPGLFWSSGEAGVYLTYYYTIKNEKFHEEVVLEDLVDYTGVAFDYTRSQKTSDDELYAVGKNVRQKLKMYTVNRIKAIGWNTFLNESVASANSMYADVPLSSWYFDAVKYAVDKGVMSGVSDTNFAPDTVLTRAMFVTMLYRMEKEPSTTKVNYKDVPKGSWFENAISWASKKGLVNGVTDKEFAPNAEITREQLMTILYRYAKYKKKGVSANELNVKAFIDNVDISPYSVDAMNWAIENGLISGTGGKYLTPFGAATRAQAAVILQRFCEKYNI
ncbi:MAG: S-layer homology domain-containing protein [Clostridia bacterium]|nr:S-layer homology domain-containing protein [Clostridia bacterium]